MREEKKKKEKKRTYDIFSSDEFEKDVIRKALNIPLDSRERASGAKVGGERVGLHTCTTHLPVGSVLLRHEGLFSLGLDSLAGFFDFPKLLLREEFPRLLFRCSCGHGVYCEWVGRVLDGRYLTVRL